MQNYTRALILEISPTGYSSARKAVERLTNHEYYRGSIRKMVVAMLEVAKMYAEGVTHKMTGTLSRAHRIQYNSHTMYGHLFLAEEVSKDGVSAAEYGIYEHMRGGSHAFYERTFNTLKSIWTMTGVRILLADFSDLGPGVMGR